MLHALKYMTLDEKQNIKQFSTRLSYATYISHGGGLFLLLTI